MSEQVHPDLALLLEPEHQSICCMALSGCACELEELQPFHRYEEDDMTALLFENIEEILPFMQKAEAILEKTGGMAGISGPFALSVSARAVWQRRALRWKSAKDMRRAEGCIQWVSSARPR